jgi:hypothetical protein
MIPSFGDLSGVTALVVANSESAPVSVPKAQPISFPPLPSVVKDGHQIARWLEAHRGSDVRILINGSCVEMRDLLRSLSLKETPANRFKIFYFGGHSYIDDKGTALVCADGDLLFASELLAILSESSAPVVVLADTSFGLGLSVFR